MSGLKPEIYISLQGYVRVHVRESSPSILRCQELYNRRVLIMEEAAVDAGVINRLKMMTQHEVNLNQKQNAWSNAE